MPNNERDESVVLRELMEQFPPEAVQKVSGGWTGFKPVGIKAQYIIERLNDVFGIFGWDHHIAKGPDGNLLIDIVDAKNKNGEQIKYAVCYGTLDIIQRDGNGSNVIKSISSHGGMLIQSGNIGDAFKGAKTDSLGKCASYIGVAHEAYKGQLDNTPIAPQESIPIIKTRQKFINYATVKGLSKETLQEEAQKCFDKIEPINAETLTIEEWNKYYSYLEQKYGKISENFSK